MQQSRVTKPKITAFLKEQCGWSRGVRSVLGKYGLLFEEKQVHIPENYQEMVMKSGQHLQPTLIVDDTILADVSGEELEVYLLSNRYIQSKLEQMDGVDLNASCTPEEEEAKQRSTVMATMTKSSMGGLVNG